MSEEENGTELALQVGREMVDGTGSLLDLLPE